MEEEAPKTQPEPTQSAKHFEVTDRDIKDMFKTINNLQKDYSNKATILTLDILHEHVKSKLPDKSFVEEIVKKLDEMSKLCYDASNQTIIPL